LHCLRTGAYGAIQVKHTGVHAVKKSMSAWMLILCYCITWGTAAFHSHECCHQEVSADTEICSTNFANATVPNLIKTSGRLHSVDSASLRPAQTCCAVPGFGDCDQAQFFPTGRRGPGTGTWQDQMQGLVTFDEPASVLTADSSLGRTPSLQPCSPLASIVFVRLLI
jgi:hypothetical protein